MKPKKSFTAYSVTQCDEPTLACMRHRRKDTLARVIEIWGPNWKKEHPRLRIIKVIVTEVSS